MEEVTDSVEFGFLIRPGSGSYILMHRDMKHACVVQLIANGFAEHEHTTQQDQTQRSKLVLVGHLTRTGLAPNIHPRDDDNHRDQDGPHKLCDIARNVDGSRTKRENRNHKVRPTSGTNDGWDGCNRGTETAAELHLGTLLLRSASAITGLAVE